MSSTIGRTYIIEEISRKTGLSRKQSAAIFSEVLEAVIEALLKGEEVKIPSFGTFSTRYKRQRMGRNPKTGTDVPITARLVPTFRASNILKQTINLKNEGPRAQAVAN